MSENGNRRRVVTDKHQVAQDAARHMGHQCGPYQDMTRLEVLEAITLDVRNHGMYQAGAVREVTDHAISTLSGLRDRIDTAIGAMQDGRA